tara:strand:- start:1033 stop:1686 length:654 start_codon:yes stop_codon:yes gene_type:complete
MNMKTFISCLALTLAPFGGGFAYAGAAETPVTSVGSAVVSTVSVTDWSGFYAGVSYGFVQDSMASYQNGAFGGNLFVGGDSFGGFAGYNFQRANFVYGAELGYTAGPFAAREGFHTLTTQDYLDLKLRLGYSMGKVLFYGFAGYSTATFYEDSVAPATTIDGLNYGVGVDYQITERIFAGVEYVARDLSGEFDQTDFPNWTFEGPSSSVNLRVGFSF